MPLRRESGLSTYGARADFQFTQPTVFLAR